MSNLRIRKSLLWIAIVSLCLLNAAVTAQEEDLRLPISLDADSTDYDGKSSMLMFRGLRLSQGNLGIQADEGRASKLDFEDSVWHFSGNVIIDVEKWPYRKPRSRPHVFRAPAKARHHYGCTGNV